MRRRDIRSAHTCETLCEMSSGMSFVCVVEQVWSEVRVAEGVAEGVCGGGGGEGGVTECEEWVGGPGITVTLS